ncbi:MAG: GerMN domain-containing protein [Bacillota bacterium]
MSKRYAVLIAVLLCFTLVFSGCSNPLTSLREFFNRDTQTAQKEVEEPKEEMPSLSEVNSVQPENTRATVMYYKDFDNYLVPVMRYIPKDPGIAKAAINALIYSEETAADLAPTGLLPSLPMGTKILGAVIKDNKHAVIDFSKEFLTFTSAKAEEAGIKAVVYTLTEFPNIETVQIRVEGKAVDEMPLGTKLLPEMRRDEINLQTAQISGDKLSKVMVYYQKKGKGEYSYFLPVTKLVSGFTNSVEAALTALLEKPEMETGLISPFPEGTKLLGVQVKDGIAYINFSQEILANKDDPTAERAMMKAVTLTLKDFNVISKAKLFVDGKILEDTHGIGANEYVDVPVFVNFYE